MRAVSEVGTDVDTIGRCSENRGSAKDARYSRLRRRIRAVRFAVSPEVFGRQSIDCLLCPAQLHRSVGAGPL